MPKTPSCHYGVPNTFQNTLKVPGSKSRCQTHNRGGIFGLRHNHIRTLGWPKPPETGHQGVQQKMQSLQKVQGSKSSCLTHNRGGIFGLRHNQIWTLGWPKPPETGHQGVQQKMRSLQLDSGTTIYGPQDGQNHLRQVTRGTF